jgi:hypothetical protein
MSVNSKIDKLLEEFTLPQFSSSDIKNHFQNNYGKYLAGAGVLGASYLGNEYLNDHPEIGYNAKSFGSNVKNIWTSDLPMSIKAKLTGIAKDSALQAYQNDIHPGNPALAELEVNLPKNCIFDSGPLKLHNNFIGLGLKDGENIPSEVFFNQKNFNDANLTGPTFTLGGTQSKLNEKE